MIYTLPTSLAHTAPIRDDKTSLPKNIHGENFPQTRSPREKSKPRSHLCLSNNLPWEIDGKTRTQISKITLHRISGLRSTTPAQIILSHPLLRYYLS